MQYKIGTVSVTNGSATVTGSGTLWLANLAVGNLFTKEGDSVAYTIASVDSVDSVDSDTVIQLTAPYAGSTSSGSNYGVTIDFTSNGLPLLSPQDLNTAAIYNEAIKNIDNDLSAIDGTLSGLGTAAQADLTTGTFSPTFGESYGSIITEGAGAAYSASYQILNNKFVTIELTMNFDDVGSTPSVGDRIRMRGFPAAVEEKLPISCCGIGQLYASLASGNNAFYAITRTSETDMWLTCTSVFGTVDYGAQLNASITYEIA